MIKGMLSRMGDEAKPSMALLDRHVRYLDNELNEKYKLTTSAYEKREYAHAGLSNLSFWLGWVRSAEGFGLDWEDMELVHPEDVPHLELPDNCCCLQYRCHLKQNPTGVVAQMYYSPAELPPVSASESGSSALNTGVSIPLAPSSAM